MTATILAVVSLIVAVTALGLTARTFAFTWPGHGVHIRSRRMAVEGDWQRWVVTIRVMGSGVVYEPHVAVWGSGVESDPEDEQRPRMDCTSEPFEVTVWVPPDRTTEAWVGLIWITTYWGAPVEHCDRRNLSLDRYERWHWSLPTYFPGQPVRGRWRTIDPTPPDRLPEIPRRSDDV